MSPRDNLIISGAIIVLFILLFWGIQSTKDSVGPTRPVQSSQKRVATENIEIREDAPTLALAPVRNTEEIARVTRVIDGDTFVINGGQSVRMIGMDTPELHQKNNGPAECYAAEATQRATELLQQKDVRLVRDISNTDTYGRLLRYVYVGDVFVNKSLVAEGFAHARAYRPDTLHHNELLAAMKSARVQSLGMWGVCK